MESFDLVTKLQKALLAHQQKAESEAEHPTITYIRNVLLNDDDGSDAKDQEQEQQFGKSFQDYLNDLTAIVQTSSSSASSSSSNIIDSKERILAGSTESLLMQAARAAVANNPARLQYLAEKLTSSSASSTGTGVERATFYFLQALIARVSGNGAQMCKALAAGITTRQYLHVRLLNLPAFRVMEVYAKETILERCKGYKRLHVVDFGILYGLQWPSLMKALSETAEGPVPLLKITGIDFPGRVDVSRTGRQLGEYARQYGLSLEYEAIATHHWESVQVRCSPEECLIVNINMRLRHVKEDGTAAKNPRKLLFENIRNIKPQMMLLSLASANLSSPLFFPRFQEAVRYYTAKLEYVDAVEHELAGAKFLIEKIINRNIMNVVACEGKDRTEMPNSYENWDSRVRQAEFKQLPLCENVRDKVSAVWRQYQHIQHVGIGSDENWILLRWKDVNLYAMSAWEPVRSEWL